MASRRCRCRGSKRAILPFFRPSRTRLSTLWSKSDFRYHPRLCRSTMRPMKAPKAVSISEPRPLSVSILLTAQQQKASKQPCAGLLNSDGLGSIYRSTGVASSARQNSSQCPFHTGSWFARVEGLSDGSAAAPVSSAKTAIEAGSSTANRRAAPIGLKATPASSSVMPMRYHETRSR